jgi:hypothetical protein
VCAVHNMIIHELALLTTFYGRENAPPLFPVL